jgi:O-antigen ligase
MGEGPGQADALLSAYGSPAGSFPASMAAAAGADRRSAGRAGSLGDRLAFWAAVALTLVFSQFWITAVTGPGSDPVDPAVSAMMRNVFYPVYLGVLALGLTRPRGVAAAMVHAPLLMLLLAVTFLSMLWTIDADVTWRRVVAVAFTTLAGLVMAERFTWPIFLEVLATALAIDVVLCFAYALLAPAYGIMSVDFPGAWRGVWSHKNQLGYNMSIAFIVFSVSALANPARRWLWIGAMAGALALILLSTSKTSLASCVLAAGCVLFVALARRGRLTALAATYGLVVVLAALVFVLFASPDILPALLGKDATFTGRTKIWAAVMTQIAKRPLTGYGFGAVWNDTSPWGPFAQITRDQGFEIHEAHNAWLGVWLELGYIGLAAWGLLLAGMWLRTLRAMYAQPAAYFAMPFLALFTLHSFTESVVLAPNDMAWLILSATALKLAWPDRPSGAFKATGRAAPAG